MKYSWPTIECVVHRWKGSHGLHYTSNIMYVRRLQWDSRFNLGLNAAKSADCIKKYFKEKLFIIKFPIKNLLGAYPLFSPEMELRCSKDLPFFKSGIGKTGLGLNTSKNTDWKKLHAKVLQNYI